MVPKVEKLTFMMGLHVIYGVSCLILGRRIVYRMYEEGLTAYRKQEIPNKVIP